LFSNKRYTELELIQNLKQILILNSVDKGTEKPKSLDLKPMQDIKTDIETIALFSFLEAAQGLSHTVVKDSFVDKQFFFHVDFLFLTQQIFLLFQYLF
jgi:hypothetical protein